MSFPNPTAATQGRGFGREVRPPAGRTTRRLRALLTFAALAVAPLGAVGCKAMPMAQAGGAAARMVAAVEASREAPGDVYERPAAQGETLLAGTR